MRPVSSSLSSNTSLPSTPRDGQSQSIPSFIRIPPNGFQQTSLRADLRSRYHSNNQDLWGWNQQPSQWFPSQMQTTGGTLTSSFPWWPVNWFLWCIESYEKRQILYLYRNLISKAQLPHLRRTGDVIHVSGREHEPEQRSVKTKWKYLFSGV